ncbi:SAVED domain-containing protein [Curtobacterium sp. NPDC098951]|uniref:SAVED domain-containing protein n=1 Tax=Curtobacterium sp. NPDC098951 TaxID=3363974 RepID=UPI003817B4C5
MTKQVTKGPNEGRERDTAVLRTAVPESTRLRLWAKAAGRCVLCATYLLDATDWTWHAIPNGQIAHIVGAGSGEESPRGDSALVADERAFEKNLMLLCYSCHKRIDDKAYRDQYTVEYLTAKKLLHENRVRQVTDFATLRPTSVVTVSADVRGTRAPISLPQVAEALRADGYTGMGEDTRNGAFSVHLPGNDDDGWAWNAHRTEIDRFAARIAEAVTAGDVESLSVFALAPIPSLVYLGSKLDDKTETRLFARKRTDEVTAWVWSDDDGDVPVFDTVLRTGDSDEATVLVELSGSVKEERLPGRLRELPRVTIAPKDESPRPDLLGSRAAMESFALAWRDALACIESELPSVRVLHLVAAVPAPAAITMGRHRMRGAQPNIVVYQLRHDAYETAMEVGE